MTTTETRKQTGRVNAITGIIVDHINRDLVVAALKDRGEEVDKESTTEQLAVQLWTVFEPMPMLKDGKPNKIRCVKCHGIGLQEQDNCPYCGHDEGEDLTEAAPAAPAPTEAQQPMKKAEAAEKSGKKAKKSAKATETNGAVNGASTALAKDDTKASSEVQTEGQLDDAVKRVQTLKGDAAASGWSLGAAIQDIYQRGLWKLRVEKNDKGKVKPRWASFEAFCNAELAMSPTQARTLMDVSQNYTEAQVRAWGTTKLGLVLSAPPEDRPRLQARVEQGAGTAEVRDEVKKVKRAKSYTKPSRAGNARGGKTGQKGKAAKQITVASILGTQTVKLFKKPDAIKKDLDLSELARAKKLGDLPFGKLELTNDVHMLFLVQENAAGELQLKVVTQRDE